jgi:Holliday junction resolvasome RuvABC DNA-binding subunit
MRLLGFAQAGERDWFRLLTTVQGVGSKVALAILSALSTEELQRACAAGDAAQVARAQGVGPKLAGRIVNELKDKAGALPEARRACRSRRSRNPARQRRRRLRAAEPRLQARRGGECRGSRAGGAGRGGGLNDWSGWR